MAETDNKITIDGIELNVTGNYGYSSEGILYYIPILAENVYGTPEPIANHAPILKRKRTIDDGTVITEDLIFQTLRGGKLSHEIQVTFKDILSSTPQIKFDSACRIYQGRGNKSLYSDFMQVQSDTFNTEYVYTHTGWIEDCGKKVFLNGIHSVTECGLTDKYNVQLAGPLSSFGFCGSDDPERWTTFRRLFDVAPKTVIYLLLGLCFMSPLNKMLRDTGYEPNFAVYVLGRTGAKKTTLSLLFSNFFGRFTKSPPETFNSTPNAVEMTMSLCSDIPLLIDDRRPSVNPGDKAKLEALEQSILRCIGERTPRARLNADSTLKKGHRPNSNVIITAETAFENTGSSAIARAVTCELHTGDVNNDSLTYVQDHAEHLNQIMAGYIQYVIQHYDELQKMIDPTMKALRKAGQADHGRLNDCAAQLQIAIMIMYRFLIDSGVYVKDDADTMTAESWKLFIELGQEQQKRIEAETPVNMFLNAFNEILNNGSMAVIKKNGKISEWTKEWIYERDEDYCVNPHSLYSKVMQYFTGEGTYFSRKIDGVCKDLLEGGYLNTSGKGKTSNVVTINGNKYRLLCIRKDRLPKLIEEEN